MRSFLVTLLAATALCSAAHAEIMPSPGPRDARMRTVAYDPSNVTTIVAAPGISTAIELAQNETITSITGGSVVSEQDKTAAWVVAPSPDGKRVFVQPNNAGQMKASNMQVVTQRSDGLSRTYTFDLALAQDASKAMYGVRFVYPGDVREVRAAAAAAQREEQQERAASERLSTDFMAGARNWKFVARGDHIEPTEISDNGRQTTLRFPGTTKIPAIYTGACGDSETTAAGEVRDDLVVVHTTSAMFCLRRGREVVEIKNVGYDPLGYSPRTGTSSPEVVRTVRRARWTRR